MKTRVFTIILLFLSVATGINLSAQDWTEKIQLYGHGFSIPNDYTETEYQYIANTYKVFTIEKRHAYADYGGSPSTERATIGTAANLKAINPDIKVLMYWNSVMSYESIYESNAEFAAHPEWVHSIWTTGSGAEYEIYDLENIDCQDWWVNSVVKIVEEGDLDGVFLDAGPKAEISGLTEALNTATDRVRDSIGDDKIIIYNGYRVADVDNMQAGPELIEHTSGVFIEFFLNSPLDTKEEAVVLFDHLIDAYEDGKMIVPRGTPHSVLPGTENPFLFTFASFLLFYGPNTYWIYNTGYNKTQGMFDYYPEYYDMATGQSLGSPQRNGWVYTREFENVSVRVDLENKTASITRYRSVVELPVNAALNGTATQSSTDFEGEASRAIDGNTNGAYSSGSVTHTANEASPWWQLELGSEKTINEIIVYGRTDACCADRLSDYTISVMDGDSNITFTESYTSVPNPSLSISTNNIQGQFVIIRSNDTTALSLAEIQVFESLDTLKFYLYDSKTDSVLSDVKLLYRNSEYLIGGSGRIALILSEGIHDFRFTKPGYDTLFQTIDLKKDSTVTVQLFETEPSTLNFKVYEADSTTVLNAATIRINNTEYTTNPDGSFSVEIFPGVYNYSVSKTGYETIDQSMYLNSDSTITLYLARETYQVTFQIKDEGSGLNLQDVTISMNDSVYVSNEQGICSLILEYGSYQYTLTRDGYEELSDSIDVFQDTRVNVELSGTAIGIENSVSAQVRVFPNPVNNFLHIEVRNHSVLNYELYNLLGELILSGKLNPDKNTLDLGSLMPGMYMIKIVGPVSFTMKKFIKE